jgi:serine/threonine protein kinase
VNEPESYPRRFGRYVLVDQLARGGMGELHLAVLGSSSGIQKLCVIKQILGYLHDKEYIQRFLDEAKVMAKLTHGNLVQVLESGTAEGSHFLAMEFVEGRNLREVWNYLQEEKTRLPLSLALYIVKELCRGLSFAHSHGNLELVHRDVSPPNILLSYAGEVRLVDFGLAVSTLKVQKTAPGVLLGKLPYMSPEQARGETLDARSDIFAAGVILWELITNQRRFQDELSQSEQLRLASEPQHEPPSKLNPDLPPALDLVTQRALAPNREQRFADAEQMRSEIATILAGVDPTTDASALQTFLARLFGDEIGREREERQQRLDAMQEQIATLLRDEDDTAGTLSDAIEQLDRAEPELPSADLESGSRLVDKYLIHELVGQGGMGKVYRATHLGIERVVALKILLPEYSKIPSVVDRFLMEARAANRVGHPNVIEIFDSGTTDTGLMYYAMELLEGTDLADLLHDERTLEVNQALRIAVQICEAMDAAHEAGVIHRDLKPENIYLVVREGAPDFVKVMDFGIARIQGGKSHTLPGLAVGTPDYMAPEQARSLPIDGRADIYTIGVLLYEMLTGDVPRHTGTSGLPREDEPIPPARERRSDVSEELERIILSTLELDPDARPPSMAKLRYALTTELEGRAAAVAALLNISDGVPRQHDAVEPGGPEAINITARVPALTERRSGLLRWLPAIMTGVAAVLAIVAVLIIVSRPSGTSADEATIVVSPPDGGLAGAGDSARARSRPARRRRRPRRHRRRLGRKPQKKAVHLEGTLDPFEK